MFLVVWHSLVLGLLVTLATLKSRVPPWQLTVSELVPLSILLMGYVVSVLATTSLPSVRRERNVWWTTLVTTAVFGCAFLLILLVGTPVSRLFVALVFLITLGSVPVSFTAQRYNAPATTLLVLGVGAVALVTFARPRQAEALDTMTIPTARHHLRLVSYPRAVPQPLVQGGAIASLGGDRFLLVTGEGRLFLLEWAGGSDTLTVEDLTYRVPINGDEFATAAGLPWRDPRAQDPMDRAPGEDPSNKVVAWWFRVTDVVTRRRGDQIEIFTSHYFWNVREECWIERVSRMDGDYDAFLRSADGLVWTTVFDTTPCLPLRGEGRRRGTPFMGIFGGGRMALVDSSTLLLAVGDFGFDGTASTQQFAQNPAASYGKTILIRLDEGTTEVFTSGHRNPQGLYVELGDGAIWLTEHGPQGGDELNRIEGGANYGWPHTTYGTQYGTLTWPLERAAGTDDAFRAPAFAWVPSIGVSSLLRIERSLFSSWQGDLLVGSLMAKTLFRLRVQDGRVQYAEPIPIGQRIRDIVEGGDGRIVLWTDEGAIVSVVPATTMESAEG